MSRPLGVRGAAAAARAELAPWGLALGDRRTLTVADAARLAAILKAARHAAERAPRPVGLLAYPERQGLNSALADLRALLLPEGPAPEPEPASEIVPVPVAGDERRAEWTNWRQPGAGRGWAWEGTT